jgi:protein-S-isoprenylcysteine O-methyltransferase Ste14
MWRFTKNVLFTLVVPGTVGVYLPWSLGAPPAGATSLGWRIWQLVALVPLGLGVLLYLACIWEFGVRGHGTPAPIDPPRTLVVWGPYRYVRNPMYIAVALVVLGWVFFFQSPSLLAYLTVVLGFFQVFVLAIEEPSLYRLFGTDYEAYRRAVRRWLPGRPFGSTGLRSTG